MRFSFEAPGRPVPQGSMRALGAGRMIHSSKALQPWRDTVAWHARQRMPHGWAPDGPMAVDCAFHLPRPNTHHLQRTGGRVLKSTAPWWPAVKPDLDKLVRALLDALTQAGIWGDDSQVVHLTAQKHYHDGAGMLACAVERLTERNP